MSALTSSTFSPSSPAGPAVNLMQASRQWASRPADERFVSLLDLRDHFRTLKLRSKSIVVPSKRITLESDPADERSGLLVRGHNGTSATLSHWSFGQIATLAGAPAGYLRTLDARLAADNLNYGLKVNRDIADVGILTTRNAAGDSVELRAATGPNYGRVWNADITESLVRNFGDGVSGDWTVPGEFGKAVTVDKNNTTFYGSDRDMFVFLADENNRIEMNNRRAGKSGSLARGFFVWNSEVGSTTFGVAMFLFDYVCKNRIVWGARGYKEVKIRHTSSAPDRWIGEVAPLLSQYSNASPAPIEDTIKAAQAAKIDKDVSDWLAARKFSKPDVSRILSAHENEEGRPIETVWDAVTGITAAAKTLPYQDERVAMERAGGRLLDLVAA